MSKAEILSELPRLTPDERAEIAAPAGAPSRVSLRESYVSPFHSSAGSTWREVEKPLRKES